MPPLLSSGWIPGRWFVESPSGEFEQAAKLTDRCLFESGDDMWKGRACRMTPGPGTRPVPAIPDLSLRALDPG